MNFSTPSFWIFVNQASKESNVWLGWERNSEIGYTMTWLKGTVQLEPKFSTIFLLTTNSADRHFHEGTKCHSTVVNCGQELNQHFCCKHHVSLTISWKTGMSRLPEFWMTLQLAWRQVLFAIPVNRFKYMVVQVSSCIVSHFLPRKMVKQMMSPALPKRSNEQ